MWTGEKWCDDKAKFSGLEKAVSLPAQWAWCFVLNQNTVHCAFNGWRINNLENWLIYVEKSSLYWQRWTSEIGEDDEKRIKEIKVVVRIQCLFSQIMIHLKHLAG